MGVQLTELTAFVAVAEQLSFTKAAVQVGVALPTMSQTIRSLEERLGVRLFNRTTRSVALTEDGDRLLLEIQPIIAGIDHALESVNLFRDNPVGTLRLAVARPAATRVSCCSRRRRSRRRMPASLASACATTEVRNSPSTCSA